MILTVLASIFWVMFPKHGLIVFFIALVVLNFISMLLFEKKEISINGKVRYPLITGVYYLSSRSLYILIWLSVAILSLGFFTYVMVSRNVF